MAVLYTLGVVVILAGLTQFSPQIVSFVAGPAPEYVGPIFYANGMEGDVVATSAAGGTREDASLNSSLSPDSSIPPVSNPGSDGTADSNPTVPPKDMPEPMPIWPGEQDNNDAWQKWMERQQLIQKALNAISPITNFQYDIANALISDTSFSARPLMMDSKISSPGYYGSTKTTVWDALGSVWVNILVLMAEILAAFGIAYVKFLRTDIR
jgi:ABC-type transport system involved in multi-copper enzyme maturation permease subunit